MDVELRIDYEGTTVAAEMAMDDGYPLMRLAEIDP